MNPIACCLTRGGRRRIHRLIALVALAAPGLASSAVADSLDDAFVVMEKIDQAVAELQVDAAPLEDVVDILGALLDVPVHADWEALRSDLTLERDDRLTLSLRRAPGSVILAGVELELAKIYGRPHFEFDGDRVVLTTRKGAAAFAQTDAYDIRAMLADDHVLAELRRSARIATAAETPPPADDGAPPTEPADVDIEINPAPPSPGRAFASLLMRHVAPDEWIAYGGHSAEITERNGVLVISAPPTIHRRLHETIDRLRRLTPLTIEVDVALVTLPRVDWLDLERRRDPRDDIFARRLRRDDRATTAWSTRLRGVFEKPMSVEAATDAGAVRLNAVPRWDHEKHLVNLAIEFEHAAGGEERAAATTVALPADGDVFLLDLPGLDPETVAVLIVDTTGR